MTNGNVKIAKQLVRLAKSMVAADNDFGSVLMDINRQSTALTDDAFNLLSNVIVQDALTQINADWITDVDVTEIASDMDFDSFGMYAQEAENATAKYLESMKTMARKLVDKWNETVTDTLNEAEKSGKKYILQNGRIRACKNFSDVKKGDLGGFVESEDNLSHDGNCWVYGDAKVYNDAKVYGNAKVLGGKVYDGAEIYGDAVVTRWANVSGEGTKVYGKAKVSLATVFNGAEIYGEAEVIGDVKIYGKGTKVYGKAKVWGEDTKVYGGAEVYGDAEVCHAKVYGKGTKVYGDAKVSDYAEVDYEVSEGEITE